MKHFIKKIKLSKSKRFIILGTTSIAAVLTISLGSTFFVSKKGRLSTEYGGGAEYIVKIEPQTTGDKASKSKAISTDVAQEIYNRIDSLGIAGAQVNPEISEDGARIRVTYPGVTSESERKEIETLITSKPKLVLTDIFGNPLFDANQEFNDELVGAKRRLQNLKIKDSNVPFVSGSAKDLFSKVQINISPSKTAEWTKATKYISNLKDNQNKVLAWLDLDKFIDKIKTNWPSIWNKSRGNPLLAAKAIVPSKDGKSIVSGLRKHTIDASKYLISEASVKQALSGESFVIEGDMGPVETKDLSRRINYGSSKYDLNLEYSNYVKATYGKDSFKKAMMAGIIVFAIIAIFLIANYGLLGALSTISIALYVFITLSMFTVMRGQYSPESIAALIIGVGMAVDANIIIFERLKNEVYHGSQLQKGFEDANKKSMSTILDANITTLIVALVLFFFGTRNIIGLSVTLILSIILTLVLILGFTKFTSTMLIKTKIFDNRLHLLGFKPKFDVNTQNKINKFDYVKNAKWFNLVSGFIFVAALITLIVTVAISQKLSGGFNLSQEFTGGTSILIVPKDGTDFIPKANAESIKTLLVEKGIDSTKIEFIKNSDGIASIKYNATKTFADAKNWKIAFEGAHPIQFIQSITTNVIAKKLVFNAMISIAIAIVGIVLYTLFRFKWTYSISAIIAILHDALIVISFFVITRIQISPVFIAGLLSIIGYSINDTIVTFDRLRENINNFEGELTNVKIKEIANTSIKETLKRSLLTSITTIIAVIVLMSFGNATKMSFNVVMLVGLMAGTYSSIFIATFIWSKLEVYRQRRIKSRKNSSFWKTEGAEEQTFVGINDFKN